MPLVFTKHHEHHTQEVRMTTFAERSRPEVFIHAVQISLCLWRVARKDNGDHDMTVFARTVLFHRGLSTCKPFRNLVFSFPFMTVVI